MYPVSVSIGIPTLNGPDRLRRVLQSIAECTNFANFKESRIVVVDDCSRPEDVEKNWLAVKDYERFNVAFLKHETRRGIAASWNDCVRHAPADVHVLLNDDVEMMPHWLEVLVYSVTKNPHAGMISLNAYTALTKGQVQQRMFKGAEKHEIWPRVDYCESKLLDGGGQPLLCSQGYAFAFSRESFDLVGGFDERYFCYYEEVDFGVALLRKGKTHYVASYPIVYHMGGATNSDPANMNASAEMQKSRAAFIEKWGGTPAEERAKHVWNGRPHLDEWNSMVDTLRD